MNLTWDLRHKPSQLWSIELQQESQAIQWENRLVNKQHCDGCRRMKLDPYLTQYPVINSQGSEDLTLGAKTIQLSEESSGINLCHLVLVSSFLDVTPKLQAIKKKTAKLDFFKIERFSALKANTKEAKWGP